MEVWSWNFCLSCFLPGGDLVIHHLFRGCCCCSVWSRSKLTRDKLSSVERQWKSMRKIWQDSNMGESIDYWVSLSVYRSLYSIESLMSWRHGREDRYRRVVCCLPKNKMDGWMVGNILVRIPPSTPTSSYIFYIFFFFFFVVIWELLGGGGSL